MARLCTLFSSSSGNSVYIGWENNGILIDAGVSATRILKALKEKEIARDSIRALIITHDHSDHVKGLRVLLKHIKVPVYASVATACSLVNSGLFPTEAEIRVLDSPAETAGAYIKAFPTPHDTAGSIGCRIALPDGTLVGLATDLGEVTPEVENGITGCDAVVLESNYDLKMLNHSRYPYYLIKRIGSNTGHLCNDSSAEMAVKLAEKRTKAIVLAHLSRENNTPELAFITTARALESRGASLGNDVELDIAPADNPGRMIML